MEEQTNPIIAAIQNGDIYEVSAYIKERDTERYNSLEECDNKIYDTSMDWNTFNKGKHLVMRAYLGSINRTLIFNRDCISIVYSLGMKCI